MTETKNRNCSECGEPIGEKRLQARPKATLCIECQQANEAKGNFTRHKIETSQEIAGWQFEGVVSTLIKGDE